MTSPGFKEEEREAGKAAELPESCLVAGDAGWLALHSFLRATVFPTPLLSKTHTSVGVGGAHLHGSQAKVDWPPEAAFQRLCDTRCEQLTAHPMCNKTFPRRRYTLLALHKKSRHTKIASKSSLVTHEFY